MAYTDVITRAEAKNYLKVDTSITADDTLIDQLIGAALQYVEKYTNVLVVRQASKKYPVNHNRQVRVYDYPVNAVNGGWTAGTEYNVYQKPGYLLYDVYTDADTLDLDVGHDTPANVPDWVKPIGLALVNAWYHDVEVDSQEEVPARIKAALRRHKRFVI